MKIAVAGTGYVGLSLAILLSQKNEVVALDVIPEKVEKINNRISPIEDEYIEKYLKEKRLNLRATLDYKDALSEARFVVISTPTNYDDETHFFDISSVEDIIKKVISLGNKNTTIVVKSTIPVGFIDSVKKKYGIDNIIFSPEFLREGHALYDNLHPSRIVVGGTDEKAKEFGQLLKDAALDENVEVLYMGSKEAESVKLFANTYLALRVSYFNELDTYAEIKGLNTNEIIDGVCLDPRIGNYYNNPSFGYGGYCLPKDAKQLLANYRDVPENLIEAIVESNSTRKKHIVDMVLKHNPKIVGVYRLTMKSGSDNFRASAIFDIIKELKSSGAKIVVYEPTVRDDKYEGLTVIRDLSDFMEKSDIILANRYSSELESVKDKVYSRDIYFRD